jgi:PHP family Zn ribbon phosphoesterase
MQINMITAKEAQKISLENDNLQEVLNEIASLITQAAIFGNTSTIYRYSNDSGIDMYATPQQRNAKTKKLIDKLEKLGYTVTLFYEERSIAVDIGLKISWD